MSYCATCARARTHSRRNLRLFVCADQHESVQALIPQLSTSHAPPPGFVSVKPPGAADPAGPSTATGPSPALNKRGRDEGAVPSNSSSDPVSYAPLSAVLPPSAGNEPAPNALQILSATAMTQAGLATAAAVTAMVETARATEVPLTFGTPHPALGTVPLPELTQSQRGMANFSVTSNDVAELVDELLGPQATSDQQSQHARRVQLFADEPH